MFGVHATAISDALKSFKEFVSPSKPSTNFTREEFEINILSDEIDIPDGELRNRVLDALDPYSSARDNLKYEYTCFIGFDIGELAKKCEAADFQAIYQNKSRSCYENVKEKIANDDILKKLNWQFFFIPFNSVDEFRAKFLKELNA